MEGQDKHHRMSFASLSGKQVDSTFDGGILTSNSGAMLLREVEAKIGILYRIVEAITDRRHPSYVDHQTVDLVKQRVFQMACGYEDANDCNTMRLDPGFKAACDWLPLSGRDLASQPTMSRFENRISRTDLLRIAKAFADVFLASYEAPPEAILLDIDDTEDRVYGSQQLSLTYATIVTLRCKTLLLSAPAVTMLSVELFLYPTYNGNLSTHESVRRPAIS